VTDDQVLITPSGPVTASIRPPGSKSITNRALVCAAMADGSSTLAGALDSEDTQVMMQALVRLGLKVEHDADSTEVRITGCGGRLPCSRADLFVVNSGTTIRFLTAMLAACQGEFRLDGNERMRQRPIGPLASALNQLGAKVSGEQNEDCPPVLISASGLAGGSATVRGDLSSQFLSGLLIACPYAVGAVELSVDGPLVSQPYIRMTLKVMAAFGVAIDGSDLSHFSITGGQRYHGIRYTIEPDASAASYFWGAAAVTGGEVTVEGLTRDSLQGDVAFCECLARMGCRVDHGVDAITVRGPALRGIDIDMNAISDTVQTLAAVALVAEGPTTITGVAHIRHKETDRIGDLARELRKLGAEVDELPDGLKITPGDPRGAVVETYNDHRMAMSLALVGLKVPGVVIANPACTRKTYPGFFVDLATLRA